MSYCTYCGKQLPNGEQCTCSGARADASKQGKANSFFNKVPKKFFIPAAIVIVLLVIIIAFASRGSAVIDLNDYLVIEGVTGLNGRGAVSYYLDEDALMTAMFNSGSSKDISEDDLEAAISANYKKFEEIGNALSCIKVSVTPNRGLSNGETATVTATFDNSLNYKISYRFKDAKKTVAISGLPEGKIVDPFSDDVITVTFSGFSGTATASFDVQVTDDIISFYDYSFTDWTNLSNGDEITLNVSYDPRELEAHGYLSPGVLAKTFTVSGLPEYISSVASIPDELLQDMIMQSLTGSQDLEASEEYATIAAPSEVAAVYYLNAQDPVNPYTDVLSHLTLNNAVAVVTHYTVTMGSFYTYDAERWNVWIYPNWYTDPAGVLNHESASDTRYVLGEDSLKDVFDTLESWFHNTDISSVNISF